MIMGLGLPVVRVFVEDADAASLSGSLPAVAKVAAELRERLSFLVHRKVCA
jgi:hypothetical protein